MVGGRNKAGSKVMHRNAEMENQGLRGVELEAAPVLRVFSHREAHRSLDSLASPRAWK